MDIKPTNLPPVLPGSSQTTLPARDARADVDALRDARPLGTDPQVAPQRSVDPGETRLGSDPWAGTEGSRMLTGPVPLALSQAGDAVANAALPDAVRAAVDLVFNGST